MQEKEIIIQDVEHISLAAKEFISVVGDRRVFSFDGKMGAGKTTFIKAICKELQVQDNVCSPTFAICNVYFSETEGEVYHFDFYRLDSEEQALDIGVEENFYSGQWCFIEWGDNVKNLIPEDCTYVRIEEIEDKQRRIIVELQ
ncbi:MAG: tRNA (adenosine(37)-N6)-threonylcarbamoyltransferase complex ATPase subunit type 1 TsaE [Bacteroidales bacterium]|nr:tRNA (adenosine(37)-N6)-threonylcarbamoyltransferase complex ATPase subunit type 1 TsaE [Candidatus Scybalousia scybalohippi]